MNPSIIKILLKLAIELVIQFFTKKEPNDPGDIKKPRARIRTDDIFVTPELDEESERTLPEDTRPEDTRKRESNYKYILDPGHGIKTQGKRSPYFTYKGERIRFYEYYFNRIICKMVALRLEELGMDYEVTTPDWDSDEKRFKPSEVKIGDYLPQRVARAEEIKAKSNKTCLFISIHSNAGPVRDAQNGWTTASGIETFCFPNSYKGQICGNVFQTELVQATGWKDRTHYLDGIKEARFYVLRKTTMTSLLLELGFYNNRQQVEQLLDSSVQQILANTIVSSIQIIDDKMMLDAKKVALANLHKDA